METMPVDLDMFYNRLISVITLMKHSLSFFFFFNLPARHHLQDLSSPTKDGAQAKAVKVLSNNY